MLIDRFSRAAITALVALTALITALPAEGASPGRWRGTAKRSGDRASMSFRVKGNRVVSFTVNRAVLECHSSFGMNYPDMTETLLVPRMTVKRANFKGRHKVYSGRIVLYTTTVVGNFRGRRHASGVVEADGLPCSATYHWSASWRSR